MIVTAKNGGGETPAASPKSAVVGASAPVNKVLPSISGTAKDGETLKAEPGSWEGTPTITYSYQWQSCNGSGEACKPIEGATASSYKLLAGDVGATLKVIVTAKNGGGETPAASPKSAVVGASAPVNKVLPSISGTAKDGETLKAEPGSWEGTPTITYSYQWQSCNGSGEACKPIEGATASSYKLAHGDVGATLKVIVTAKNGGGETPAASPKSAVVGASAPVNKVLPSISGTAKDGETLKAEPGSWEGTPTITYSYQWQSCNGSGEACKPIEGATASTYKLLAGDVGATLKVIVTAKNGGGETPAASPKSAVVGASAPVNKVLPSISGTAKDGETLKAEPGSWEGTPTITYSYQWQSCNGSGEACKPIEGATASSYKLGSRRRRRDAESDRHGQKRRRGNPGRLAQERRRRRERPGQQSAPLDLRDRQGRRNPESRTRQLGRHPDDHLQLPVAELQRLRRSLQTHRRRNRLHLQTARQATSARR